MTGERGRPEAQATWLTAAALGALDGFLLFELPTVGLLLLAAGVLILARFRRGTLGSGGLATGAGGLGVLLLWRARAGCDAFDGVPGQGCVSPGIEGYVIAAAAILLAGLVLTAVGIRSTASGQPPRQPPSQLPRQPGEGPGE